MPGFGTRPNVGNRLGNRGERVGNRVTRRDGNRQELRTQRSDRLQQRLDGRNDRQGQRQGNRGDRQQTRRNDFSKWHDDYYHHHHGWYQGHWNGHWGAHWNHMWDHHPGLMAFGTTVWGVNRVAYWWGYRPYSNVYSTGDTTVVNYSQPIAAEPPYEEPADSGTTQPQSNGQEPLPPGVSQQGMTAFEKAQAEFAAGDNFAALRDVNAALKEMPRDAVVNEFRALVLFASGDYKHAAETLYAVLSVGPGWDWTTMAGLYGNVADYTKQLRALETSVDANPKQAEGHFVLGYHYMTCGHSENAGKQFQAALKINPNDLVSKQMLQLLGVTPAPNETQTPPGTGKKPTTIPLNSLVGTWVAKRGNASFQMTLTKDKNFTWVYSEGQRKTEVKGVFAVDGDAIAMEPDAGGVMLANLKLQGTNTLLYKMAGDEKDAGLTFTK